MNTPGKKAGRCQPVCRCVSSTVCVGFCPAVLLSCCPAVLLSCCPAVLLSCCPVALLSSCPPALLSCCPAAAPMRRFPQASVRAPIQPLIISTNAARPKPPNG